MDVNSLDRFLEAQDKLYETALSEIKKGSKCSHWMWFIFPQLRGLGSSKMSYVFGINGIEEAKAYLAHPVLSSRLIEIGGFKMKKHLNEYCQQFWLCLA